MPSSPKAAHARLLSNEGWESCVTSRLLRSGDDWQSGPEGRSHGHALRRLFEDKDIKIDAVLCLEGRPTVCVKDATALDDRKIVELRRKLWNLGATTLLMVERPTEVQLFSTFVRPAKDAKTSDAVLDNETITNLEAAALALRLRKTIRRIETGAIYREHAQLFDSKSVVDQQLLSNLHELRNLICPERDVESYRRAHALIGRFLFSCYLMDRGIIGETYLAKNGLEPASDMQRLLEKATMGQGQTLSTLFKALHKDFNGSLFGEQVTEPTDHEVQLFRRFLSGDDLKSGQLSLFKLYDFSFIPVELISSIYQDFIEVEAEAEAEPTTKNQPKNSGQRVQGAYYTPPRLAELTIDIATQGWDTLLDKRCLDGACGSGIFVTILFVRMAEEWRRRNPEADTKQRYDALKRILAENICGVDINHTACLVACFSLYLAFLDQMEPKAITELREALERDYRTKILPRILWEKGENPPQLRTVRELDFFDLPPTQEFDLVVGNPPWVSRKDSKTKSAENWILSEQKNPAAKGLLKSKKNKTLFPAGEVATGFMWKASLHSKPGGRVCQVLPSRVFLANQTDDFQVHWLERHRLESLWLLADYSFILFPGAACPCFIGRYHARAEGEALGAFEFITPKVEPLDPREALIPVQAEDQKTISEADIMAAAKADQAAFGWKKHHWGTPRDVRLVERLMRLPKLKRLTYQPGKGEKPKGIQCWPRGQGFQPATASTLTKRDAPAPVFWKTKDRFLNATTSTAGLLLSRDETEQIGDRYSETGLLFPRHPSIYKSPLVLINQGFTKFVFSSFDVLFQHSLQSVSAPKSDESKLQFLTAFFSTPLAQYLGLHTSVNVGVERDKVSFEDLLGLPFPLPGDMPDPKAAQAIIDECAAIFDELKASLSAPEQFLDRETLVAAAKRKLETKVYAYFGIKKWERHLIEDSVEMFLESSTPASRDSEKLITCLPSKERHRKAYADELVATFQGWTRTKERLWAACTTAPASGLAMLTFGVGGKAPATFEKTGEERVEKLLSELREGSEQSSGTVFRTMRSFAFYDGAKVHLLKPLNRRHWTRTAAQNDADAIIAQMMEEDGWSA